MWNMYEQPWLLITISFGLFLIVGTLRSVNPDKIKSWAWAVPLLVFAAGFVLDYGVKTGREKVVITLNSLLNSAQNQDVQSIAPLVAADYSDSYHRSKARLIGHMKSRFSKPVFEKIKKLSLYINSLENGKAKAALNAAVVFHPESAVAQIVGRSLIARLEFEVSRQSDGQWLLSKMELIEVNKQPVNWRQASGQF
jgi:hypothetical protein